MRTYLRELRTDKNESMEQVARLLGITRQYYEMIESGKRKKNMDVLTLYRLSKHFQVSLNYLVKKELDWMKNIERKGA